MVSRYGYGGNRSWSVRSNCHDVRMEVQGKASKKRQDSQCETITTIATITMTTTLLRGNYWTQLGGADFEVKQKLRNHATPTE
jgi:hypothetical protein